MDSQTSGLGLRRHGPPNLPPRLETSERTARLPRSIRFGLMKKESDETSTFPLAFRGALSMSVMSGLRESGIDSEEDFSCGSRMHLDGERLLRPQAPRRVRSTPALSTQSPACELPCCSQAIAWTKDDEPSLRRSSARRVACPPHHGPAFLSPARPPKSPKRGRWNPRAKTEAVTEDV
jgi:hypothetical protein